MEPDGLTPTGIPLVVEASGDELVFRIEHG
jgi:hypothetical protein